MSELNNVRYGSMKDVADILESYEVEGEELVCYLLAGLCNVTTQLAVTQAALVELKKAHSSLEDRYNDLKVVGEDEEG